MRYPDLFGKIYEILAIKKTKSIMYLLVFALLLLIFLKNSKLTVKGIKGTVEEAKSKTAKAMGEEDNLEDFTKKFTLEERRQKMIAKILKAKKDKEERIRKEEEKKRESLKKEITPEDDVDAYGKAIEETRLTETRSFFTKLQQVEDKYQQRREEGLIKHNGVARTGDYIYYNARVVSEVNIPDDVEINESAIPEADKRNMRFFIKVSKIGGTSGYFVNKKVGESFRIKTEEIGGAIGKQKYEEQKAEMNKRIGEELANNPKYKKALEEGFEVDTSKFIYEMTILDILPKSVVDELKLNEYVDDADNKVSK
ncbi:MAG: hypothetical protein LBG48_04265 [Rickettsiales bacterium]|jgi:hypothetical protein|nr:hypothetical protein [Rickettsiales bacterium]